MAFEPGTRIAQRFVIEGRLASGGMAEVFVASVTQVRGLERRVAIKRVHPHLARDPAFVSMFVDEARLASQLKHPGVVSVLDALEDRGELLLVLDYVPGWDLAAILSKAGEAEAGIPSGVAAHIVLQAAKALDYVHGATDTEGRSLGIVHRDVTPSNLLITKDGGVRLLDFGVAKAVHRATRTAVQTLKGKLAYMSPEQARHQHVDSRADIFALGLVFFELLTGHRRYDASEDAEVLQKARAPRKLDPKNLEIPEPLSGILTAMLAPNPKDRPESAARVVEELEGATAKLEGGDASATADLVSQIMGSPSRPLETTKSKVDQALLEILGKEGIGEETDVRAAGPRSLLHLDAAEEIAVETGVEAENTPSASRKGESSPRWLSWSLLLLALLTAGIAFWVSRAPTPPPLEQRAPATNEKSVGNIPGFLRVSTNPAGAHVTIDGTSWPERTPTVIEAETGSPVEILLTMSDYRPAKIERTPRKGTTRDVTVELLRLAGKIAVTSHPEGAAVELDGEPRGATPLQIDELPRREHELRIVLSGYVTYETSVDLASRSEATVHAKLAPRSERGTLWVNSDIQRVRVEVDGRVVSSHVPWRGQVSTGRHSVRVTDPGTGHNVTKQVEVSRGAVKRVGFFLRR